MGLFSDTAVRIFEIVKGKESYSQKSLMNAGSIAGC